MNYTPEKDQKTHSKYNDKFNKREESTQLDIMIIMTSQIFIQYYF